VSEQSRAERCSPWFCLIAAQGPVRQRSISADLIIHLLFLFFNGVHEIASLSILLLFDQANGEALLSAFKNKQLRKKVKSHRGY
jgi:hypothetical protein